MATLQYSAEVKRPPNDVWTAVAALDSAKHLTNMIADVEVTGVDSRVCSTQDGAKIVEKIISTDNATRRQAYTVTEGPFGHQHHNASMQVFAADNGASRLVWTIDLLPDALADQMRQPLGGEFQTIVSRLSGG